MYISDKTVKSMMIGGLVGLALSAVRTSDGSLISICCSVVAAGLVMLIWFTTVFFCVYVWFQLHTKRVQKREDQLALQQKEAIEGMKIGYR